MKQGNLTFYPPEFDEKFCEEEMRLSMDEHNKNLALGTAGILNDLDKDDSPKKWIYSDGHLYAFVYDWTGCADERIRGYGLWTKPAVSADEDIHKDQWCEVSDLTGVTVFTYQILSKIARAIGWIRNDNRNWLI